MLSYAAYKNTRLPPIVNRPMVELGGGFKLGKPVLGSIKTNFISNPLISGVKPYAADLSVAQACLQKSNDERAWNRFHIAILRELRDMQIDPNDLNNLYSYVYEKKREFTGASLIIKHVTEKKIGWDISTGTKVPFQVSVSQIPGYVGSAFTLASAVVNKVPVDDLYTKYINRIKQILSLVDDPDEVEDEIMRVFARHAAKAPRFLVIVVHLFYKDRTNVVSAKIQFDKWFDPLIDALDEAIRHIKTVIALRRANLEIERLQQNS
jgi:hypothetical protein